MTPEQKQKIREMYLDNLLELRALQSELFETKPSGESCNKLQEPYATPSPTDNETWPSTIP